MWSLEHSHKSRRNVWPSVDQALIPLITSRIRIWLSVDFRRNRDAQSIWEGEIGAIRTSLIPALDSGADGTKNDGKVEAPWLTPLVQDFVSDGLLLVLGQTGDGLKGWRVFGNEGPLDEHGCQVTKVVGLGKFFDISDDFFVG